MIVGWGSVHEQRTVHVHVGVVCKRVAIEGGVLYHDQVYTKQPAGGTSEESDRSIRRSTGATGYIRKRKRG